MSQYAVHKLWFYYNDETYEHSNVLASCIGVYNSYEAAQKAQKAADRMALINKESSDWIRDLAGFNYNADYQNFVENLTNYARSQGWDKYLIKNDKGTYSEVIPPPDITDAQMDEVLKISHASFQQF